MEFDLSKVTFINTPAPLTPLLDIALNNFREFCRKCLDVALPHVECAAGPTNDRGLTLLLRNAGLRKVDPLDPSFESFTLDVPLRCQRHTCAHESLGLLQEQRPAGTEQS